MGGVFRGGSSAVPRRSRAVPRGFREVNFANPHAKFARRWPRYGPGIFLPPPPTHSWFDEVQPHTKMVLSKQQTLHGVAVLGGQDVLADTLIEDDLAVLG